KVAGREVHATTLRHRSAGRLQVFGEPAARLGERTDPRTSRPICQGRDGRELGGALRDLCDGERYSSLASRPRIHLSSATTNVQRRRSDGASTGDDGSRIVTMSSSENGDGAVGSVREEIAQRRPFHSVKAEVAVSILRTAALIERHFAQVVAQSGITVQQYNVLRILR